MSTISYASGGSWIVCYTEPRAEAKAAREMHDIGTVHFLPMEKFRGKPGKPPVDRPLFPRYVFAKIDLDCDEWGRLLAVDGVLDVIRNCNTPSVVPNAWIAALQKAEACGMFDRTTINPHGIAIGETVRIAEGTFAGLQAVITEFVGKIRSSTATKRAKVLVNFLGRLTMMELPVCDLEKI